MSDAEGIIGRWIWRQGVIATFTTPSRWLANSS